MGVAVDIIFNAVGLGFWLTVALWLLTVFVCSCILSVKAVRWSLRL